MGSIGSRGVGVIGLFVAGALAAALAPSPALAAAADYFLKIDGVKGESADARHKGEIEVQSFSWGASQAHHHGGGGSGGNGGLGAGKVSLQDMSVMRGPRQSTPSGAAGSVVGASDPAAAGKFGAVSGVRRYDGMTGDKRTHPPLVKILKAVEPGSITLAMRLPGCAVGTRYASAELTTPDGRYGLQDLIVASCGAAAGEPVTLNYAKVKVRGWDPKKKEEVVGKAD